MSKYEQYYEQYVVNQVSANDLQDRMHDVMKAIFEAKPEINSIVTRGQTPSFNDGDPCYHSQDTVVGRVYDEYFEDTCRWDGGKLPTSGIEEDLSGYIIDEPLPKNQEIPEDQLKPFDLVVALEDDLERAFGTNIICAWLRNPKDPSDIKFFKTFIDCDY